MTRKEFEALPSRKWNEEIICDTVIILPSRRLYDSGYRCLDFVAVNSKNEPLCLLSGCSDVIYFDGIGGYGDNWINKYGHCPSLIPPSGWKMDCLPKTGLLRFWCDGKIKCGAALSSFEVYRMPNKEKL